MVDGAASASRPASTQMKSSRTKPRPMSGRNTAATNNSHAAAMTIVNLAEDLLGNRLQLQVRRAFVDLPDLRVAVELLDRIVLDEPVPAEEIHGERGDALGDFR